MSTVVKPALEPLPANAQQVVFHGISWQNYQRIGSALKDQNVYLTYDRGELEIMVLSSEHERFKGLFGLLVFTLARFFRKKIGLFGSFTHQRQDLLRCLEPDQCFYLANLDKVKGKKRIDLRRLPPPDLAIEVEITRSSLDRLGIYAALGIGEVWRFDGQTLQINVLKHGGYEPANRSPTFPEVPMAGLVKFLKLGLREDDLTMVEALESWLAKIQ